MLDQLKHLIQLQKLQNKKARLIRSRDETPKRMAEIEKEYERFESEYLVKKAEYDHAKKMHRTLEQEIAEMETRITRSKHRMSEVKTNKEYHAMLKEIEDLRRDITGREDKMLEVMETIDSAGRVVKELEKELENRKRELDKEKEELNGENEQLNERLEHLESLQQRVREKLETDILKRSDFLMRKQGGIAVAPVEGGVCQVCHLNIPPQKFIELQRDKAILQCPHCHRFVYWPGHEDYQVFEEDMEEK